jgi:hypothetical protein
MIFGNPETIAIEIGELDSCLEEGQYYVQFRFVLLGQTVGDWDYRIPLLAATGSMQTFLSCRNYRQNESLAEINAESFFAKTFISFYDYDYKRQPILRPNLRDRYHLSEVGGESICDKYGIAVADVTAGTSRVVVKDLRHDVVILDYCVNSHDIEEMGKRFLEWGEIIVEKLKKQPCRRHLNE